MSAQSFEIVVKGSPSPALLAAMDGFEVTGVDEGRTTMVGWMPDQARLHSTFALLRDLNIELLSVNPARPGDLPG